MTIKKIGILTSGGDCAGLNAVIRAVVHRARYFNYDVVGIMDGTNGLLHRPVQCRALTVADVEGYVLRLGGTILGTTNKGNPFAWPVASGVTIDRSQEIIDGIRLAGIDAVIGIGGDGSLAILQKLAGLGKFPLVGIPKTIDNDIGLTETSVGFDTAVAVATEALDRLQPTAASHARVMVLEVMGRDAGHIALHAGIAGGADIILIPEIPYNIESITKKITDLRQQGRNFALVVVSEAVRTLKGKSVKISHRGGARRFGGIGHYIGDLIAQNVEAETRVTVLGHVQRGSQPSALDRLIASAFGVYAVDLIAANKFDRMVAWSNRQVMDVPISKAIADYHAVNPASPLVHTARALGICFGD
ncbi:MAG: ATP-dependent 6-phosphofructokinase [Alphaproteobacteria bacterium]